MSRFTRRRPMFQKAMSKRLLDRPTACATRVEVPYLLKVLNRRALRKQSHFTKFDRELHAREEID
jgi:hypothetical protein